MDEFTAKPTEGPVEPLKSEFADDPGMADLVTFFVADLQGTIDRLTSAWDDQDSEKLRTLAHQLKGAGGGYGFPIITEVAGDLEQALSAEQAELTDLLEKFKALILLCRRAAAKE